MRPARRTALAVSAAAAAVALSASSSGSHHSVEAFHPPAVALPQHKHPNHSSTAGAEAVRVRQDQSDAPTLASACIIRQRRRGSSFSSLAVSASSSLDGDSAENNNPAGGAAAASADALQSMALNTAENALNTLSSAADQVVTAVSEDSDYVDEFEIEQAELSKRREAAAREAARRRNQYEITVPIVSSSKSSSAAQSKQQLMVGLTLRQVAADGQISSAALDFDSTTLMNNLSTEEEMDPTMRDGSGSVEILNAMLEDKTVVGASGGNNGSGNGKAGVIVSSVVRDGAAWEAGVRPGDLILATSATVGQVRTTYHTAYVNVCDSTKWDCVSHP